MEQNNDIQWVPSNEFEEEVVGLEPENHFIYGTTLACDSVMFQPRPKQDMELFEKKKKKEIAFKEMLTRPSLTHSQRQKLSIIHQVQKIAGTKPLDELPTTEDWDNGKNRGRETIAMMRHCGLKPSIEQPFDENKTIAPRPITKKMEYITRGGCSFPVYYGTDLFKLRPLYPDTEKEKETDTDTDEVADENDTSQSVDGIGSSLSNMNLNQSIDSNFSNPINDISHDNVVYLLPGKEHQIVECEKTEIPYKLFSNSSLSSNYSDNSETFENSFGPYFKGVTKRTKKPKNTDKKFQNQKKSSK